MTNHQTGHDAEKAAAAYLELQGFTIIELNWKTRFCEIDIVAKQRDIVYFIEVKYRVSKQQGDGLDYITSKKLHQMQFAADFWISAHSWDGEVRLAAIAASPDGFRLIEIS